MLRNRQGWPIKLKKRGGGSIKIAEIFLLTTLNIKETNSFINKYRFVKG